MSLFQERKEGKQVGDFWNSIEKGKECILEEIFEVGDEPRHQKIFLNKYTRVLRATFPPNDTTFAHRHAEDSLYFFLVENGIKMMNHVQGSTGPLCECVAFGEVRYGPHKSNNTPLVHKITNISNKTMLCIDAEILRPPPITSVLPLIESKYHKLVKTGNRFRVYTLTLEPGHTVTVSYPFFYLSVVTSIQQSKVYTSVKGPITWVETHELGDVAWREPITNVQKTNVGESNFGEYIVEWR